MKYLALNLAAALSLNAAPALASSQADCECPDLPPSGIKSGPTPFDWEAREQQVSSGDQRIGPLPAEGLPPEVIDVQNQLQAFFGGSGDQSVNTMTATMAKHPGLYKYKTLLGLELNKNGKVPPREREMVILRTAWLVRSPFEWGEHVDYGKDLGLTSDEIERITQGSSAEGWNEHDRAILRGVEELLSDYAVSEETWEILAKTWDEPQMMELPGLVGSYTLTAMVFSSLRFGMMEDNEGFSAR